MALEQFFQNYQSGESFIDHSPFTSMVDGLVRAGSTELAGIVRETPLPPAEFVNTFLVERAQPQIAALTFALTIKGLSEWNDKGAFEHGVFRDRLNSAISDTPLEQYTKPVWLEKDIEHTTLWKMGAMKKAIIDDPTYSVFFEHPEYMPDNLHRFLDDIGFFGYEGLPLLIESWKQIAAQMTTKKEEKPKKGGDMPRSYREVARILNYMDF